MTNGPHSICNQGFVPNFYIWSYLFAWILLEELLDKEIFIRTKEILENLELGIFLAFFFVSSRLWDLPDKAILENLQT